MCSAETALRTPPARSVSQSRTPVVNNSGSSGGSGGGGGNNHQWSRRSSEDSLEDGGGPSPGPGNGETPRDGRSARDLRHELKEVEDKFRKAMIQNAQLDNEKASYTYQVELLKDKVEDLEVAYAQLQVSWWARPGPSGAGGLQGALVLMSCGIFLFVA